MSDLNQPIARVVIMDRLAAITEAQRRFILILFEAFGGVALLLAAVGLYGVLVGSVAERIHEIGVRMALGNGFARLICIFIFIHLGFSAPSRLKLIPLESTTRA